MDDKYSERDLLISRYKTNEWKTLESIQNKYYPDQDILTITGMLDDEEFINHVNRYKKAAMLNILTGE
jgi:hypothetical protein